MSATIIVCILLLAKTLLDEDCGLSTTFFYKLQFANYRLYTGDGTNRLAISFLIANYWFFSNEIVSVQRWVLWLLAMHQLVLAGHRHRANGR